MIGILSTILFALVVLALLVLIPWQVVAGALIFIGVVLVSAAVLKLRSRRTW
jgi:hypothetical protein